MAQVEEVCPSQVTGIPLPICIRIASRRSGFADVGTERNADPSCLILGTMLLTTGERIITGE